MPVSNKSRSGLLVVISGLPGVGKSLVAGDVATRIGATHLSVDPVEDAMLTSGLAAGWNVGVAAYESVRVMAEANLVLGRPVVVDAVNDSEEARQTWRAAAARTDAALAIVVLSCSDPDEHRRRLERRRRSFVQLQEPTWSEVQGRAATYPAWRDDHLAIDTSGVSQYEVGRRASEYIATVSV